MQPQLQLRLLSVLLFSAFGSSAALATNGYLVHGYGVKSQGIAGVGIALPQDGLAAASNPAGTVLVGDRADLGLTWFAPTRGSEITGNGYGANGSYEGSDKKNFFIPEAGYTRQLSATTAVGLAVYGQGGMNTGYQQNPFAAFGSKGDAGIDLQQLFIAPSVAYKLNEQHAVGAALNFAYQRFSAKGLGVFASASQDAAHLTDQGADSSTGWGLHLGWTGQVTPELTLGATWSSKIKAGKFDKYKGLFADDGGFDIPENYGFGLAYKASPALTLAADVQEIKYGGVKSVANPLANLFTGNPLGSANGPGFGWRDITVLKVGASYDYSKDLTLRGGVSHTGQPIPQEQTFFNILAPGVVRDHLTLGATWKTGGGELSVSYAHAFKETVNGSNSIPASFGGGNANIHLDENILGVAYGWKL
jgi:long-chain fatty acid transport protein